MWQHPTETQGQHSLEEKDEKKKPTHNYLFVF